MKITIYLTALSFSIIMSSCCQIHLIDRSDLYIERTSSSPKEVNLKSVIELIPANSDCPVLLASINRQIKSDNSFRRFRAEVVYLPSKKVVRLGIYGDNGFSPIEIDLDNSVPLSIPELEYDARNYIHVLIRKSLKETQYWIISPGRKLDEVMLFEHGPLSPPTLVSDDDLGRILPFIGKKYCPNPALTIKKVNE